MKPNCVFRRGKNGQGTVEFALVVPLFLVVLLGTIEFSWAMYTYTTLQHAAQAGVRRGIVLTDATPNPFALDGNRPATYAAPIACNPGTMVGSAACQLGGVPLSRTQAIVCPVGDPTLPCPSSTTAPWPGATVEVQLKHEYRSLILGFFPGLDRIEITGYARGQAQ